MTSNPATADIVSLYEFIISRKHQYPRMGIKRGVIASWLLVIITSNPSYHTLGTNHSLDYFLWHLQGRKGWAVVENIKLFGATANGRSGLVLLSMATWEGEDRLLRFNTNHH